MQLDDDILLLKRMMTAQNDASDLYQATNYWNKYCVLLYEYLIENGLHDFRRTKARKHTPAQIFAKFGAVDLRSDASAQSIMNAVKRRTGGSSAEPIENIGASRVGNPEGFEFGGQFYTESWLNFYIRYAYVSRFINLSDKIIVEIGPGSAKQAHLIKLAHPNSTIILFDIAPQLYVANQYLRKAYEGQDVVRHYDETLEINNLCNLQKGKLYLFPSWKIELIRDLEFDLLWNAASFQEMEPDIVRNYLKHCHGAQYVYLMQSMSGQTVASGPGQAGVLQATTLETYIPALDRYEITDLAPAPLCLPIHPFPWAYSDSIWKRRS